MSIKCCKNNLSLFHFRNLAGLGSIKMVILGNSCFSFFSCGGGGVGGGSSTFNIQIFREGLFYIMCNWVDIFSFYVENGEEKEFINTDRWKKNFRLRGMGEGGKGKGFLLFVVWPFSSL